MLVCMCECECVGKWVDGEGVIGVGTWHRAHVRPPMAFDFRHIRKSTNRKTEELAYMSPYV